MEIRTKFKTKDRVWYIVEQENKWFVFIDFVVTFIRTLTYDDTTSIEYRYPELSIYVDEEDCFATKEEAQKECERRNGNETCNN